MAPHRSEQVDQEHYRRVSLAVGRAEAASREAQAELEVALRAGAALSAVRRAYQRVGRVEQEPLPAERALDPQRPPELSRQLSTLRTHRQWHLMDAPPGVLPPTTVVPTSRAALGPHVHGLDFDVAEEPWGVDLARVLDQAASSARA